MIQNLLIKRFGVNYQTTIAGIFTVIGLIPSAFNFASMQYPELGLDMSRTVMMIGMLCSFISFIYMSIMSKSKSVTGVNGSAKMMNADNELKTGDQIRKENK